MQPDVQPCTIKVELVEIVGFQRRLELSGGTSAAAQKMPMEGFFRVDVPVESVTDDPNMNDMIDHAAGPVT